jgi:flavin reductase (DIM6/NTAB) family NADH-FMN oxidoreductase RutF
MDAATARALADLTTGIYILTTAAGGERHGMSASWVTQVSGEPPLVAIAVDRRHRTHALLEQSGACALNVVCRRTRHLEDYFFSAAARSDNLDGIEHEMHAAGVPVLRQVATALVCRVREVHVAGDHSLFVAAVEDVIVRDPDPPLTSLDLEYVYVGTLVRR